MRIELERVEGYIKRISEGCRGERSRKREGGKEG